jgi:hypothetical protein
MEGVYHNSQQDLPNKVSHFYFYIDLDIEALRAALARLENFFARNA